MSDATGHAGGSDRFAAAFAEYAGEGRVPGRVVLEHTYDAVDHISLHMYFNNRANHTPNYLAMNAKLDRYIGTVASTITPGAV